MLGVDRNALRIAWTVFLFALAVTVVWMARRTVMVFVFALLFAYLLSPAVDFVQSRIPKAVSRTVALAIVYVLLVCLLAGAGVWVGGKIGEEAASLASSLPERIQKEDPLAGLPFPEWLSPWRARLIEMLRDRLDELDKDVLPMLTKAGTRIVEGLGSLLNAVLIPILSFFFLLEGRQMRDAMVEAAGSRAHLLSEVFDDLHDLLAQYIRALVLLAIATLVFYSIFLELIGVKYPVLLAGIAAILEVIPVVGPLAASAVILLVAGVNGFPHLLWIVVFLVLYRIFQDYVLNPYLMSSGVDVPPLLVLFGVLAGEQIAGIPGMFFSVPVIAALRIVFKRAGLFRRVKA